MLPRLHRAVQLVFADQPVAAALLPLIEHERAEFEAVLGVPVEVTDRQTPGAPAWLIELDTDAPAAALRWDGARRCLLSTVRDEAGLARSVNLLHTLAHSPDTEVTDEDAGSWADAWQRIHDEVANGYPYFGLRELDWEAICRRHRRVRALEGEAFWAGAQRWVAELGDAHTQLVLPGTRFHPPYLAELEAAGARLLRVPQRSAAWAAGVRPGWLVDVEEPGEWLLRTGASPQQRRMVAARRFLAMTTEERVFTARASTGEPRRWTERRAAGPLVEVVGATVRLSGFGPGTVDTVREALDDLDPTQEVTVDLRGNAGGSLLVATELRDLFLREPTGLGSIQFTTGQGSLAPPVPLRGTPAEGAWTGGLRVLVDPMTYSASEDFLLGLAGLPHVRVEGTRTGGGSGRPRTRRIKDGVDLLVSTALTRDRDGHPVELRGIVADSAGSSTARN